MMTEEVTQPPAEPPTTTETVGLEPTPAPELPVQELRVQGEPSNPEKVSPRPASRSPHGWNCCSLPHGSYTLLPSCLTTVAFCLSLAAHFSCQFIQRDIVLNTAGEPPLKLYNAASIGLWYFLSPGNEVCYNYPRGLTFDPFFKTCRAMAPMAAIIGGIVLIICWNTSCIALPISGWRTCGFFLLLTTLFEGLTFLVFRSNFCGSIFFADYSCALARGGRCGVAACVFWFLSAVSVWKVPRAETFDVISTRQSIITTETILPDGTKKIETKKLYEPDI